jgi:hypothetical protein
MKIVEDVELDPQAFLLVAGVRSSLPSLGEARRKRVNTKKIEKVFQQTVERVARDLESYETPASIGTGLFASASDALSGAVDANLERLDRVLGAKKFQAGRQDRTEDSYEFSDNAYVSYEIEYPKTVSSVVSFRLDPVDVVGGALRDDWSEYKEWLPEFLKQREIRSAIEDLAQSVLPENNKDHTPTSKVADDAVEFAYQKMHTDYDVDDDDRPDVPVEARAKLTAWSLSREVSIKSGKMLVRSDVEIRAEVLWPGDPEYHDYF